MLVQAPSTALHVSLSFIQDSNANTILYMSRARLIEFPRSAAEEMYHRWKEDNIASLHVCSNMNCKS